MDASDEHHDISSVQLHEHLKSITNRTPQPLIPNFVACTIFLLYLAFVLVTAISAFVSDLRNLTILRIIALSLIVYINMFALFESFLQYLTMLKRLTWLPEAWLVMTTGILWPYYWFWLY